MLSFFFDIFSLLFLLLSAFFFFAGTLGLLRFPDVVSRVHAPTKADNLGLGFLVLSLIFQAESILIVFKLLLVWLITLIGSSAVAQMIASYNYNKDKS